MTAAIAWIDVETTGTDTRTTSTRLGDKLLQFAVIVTDENYQELGMLETKFYYSPEAVRGLREQANEFVNNMHDKTKLWAALSNEANANQADFDEALYSWLKKLQPEAGVLKFGGNSIFLDREFMREFLPKSYAHLSYRSVDMTSVEGFLTNADKRERFTKAFTHDALDDIRESLAQANYHHELSALPF